MPEYYSTALHEIGHSTGHEKRLNRSLSADHGSPEYAEEEMRAEIASMFLEQDMGVEVKDKHIENNSAYIAAWKRPSGFPKCEEKSDIFVPPSEAAASAAQPRGSADKCQFMLWKSKSMLFKRGRY